MKPQTQLEKEQREETNYLKLVGAKAVGVIYNVANIAKVIGSKVPVVGSILFILYRLSYLVNHSFNFGLTVTTNKEDMATKTMRGILHFASAAVAITKLVVSKIPTPVAILTDVLDCIESIWNIGLSVKSFFIGAWNRHTNTISKKKDEHATLKKSGTSDSALTTIENEIITAENKIIDKKAKLATRIEKLAVNTAFLVGSVFLLIPPLAVVGFGILLVTGIYSVLDRFNLNPFKHIGKALFGNPFAAKPLKKETIKQPSTTGLIVSKIAANVPSVSDKVITPAATGNTPEKVRDNAFFEKAFKQALTNTPVEDIAAEPTVKVKPAA
ncbi:MAG: hypothetical protein WAW86_01575 [Gammaproteobacteria bacterium]